MQQFAMDCYKVEESNIDGTKMTHLAFVSNESIARQIVGTNAWRSFSPYNTLITVFESMEEFEANSVEALKKSAMAKLTSAEKRALGLQ